MIAAPLIALAALTAQPVYGLPPTGPDAYAQARADAHSGQIVLAQVVDQLDQARVTSPPLRILTTSDWPTGHPVRKWLASEPRPYIVIFGPGGPNGVIAAKTPPGVLQNAPTP